MGRGKRVWLGVHAKSAWESALILESPPGCALVWKRQLFCRFVHAVAQRGDRPRARRDKTPAGGK
ncbi:hypothetical protein XCR_0456 [Xanthomonas campestris pv. raphani 756C]|nr:hypothetical protein XCR_0456 [Xanthomonas campestris pv. raphani 756C]